MLIHTSLEDTNIATVSFLGETENNRLVEFPLASALATELDAPGGKDQALRNPGMEEHDKLIDNRTSQSRCGHGLLNCPIARKGPSNIKDKGGTRDHVKELSENPKSRLRRQLYEFGDSPRQTKTSDYAIVSRLAKERVKGSDRHEGQMEFA
ncbi:hypothetical protein WISP_136819 [Willisornis vidua]|uniref:Uncharacterized protein n=1 Tax=Willisornis vidua TaxID=1566151 RepID=A0ABQ9CN85_9PASS|nr:hypothetical protein WISP_136819 [Willisornis vidua]